MEQIIKKQEYDEYIKEYRCALEITLGYIRSVNTQFSDGFDIESRVKTFDSVMEKCKRKDYNSSNPAEIREKVKDLAGVRIITDFKDQIFEVIKALKAIPGLTVIKEKDYVTEPKSNGYSSYHIQAYCSVYYDGESKLIPVEIQVRDKSMDLWATIEHIVQYKNPNASSDGKDLFKQLADALSLFDEKAIELRDLT